MFDLQRQHLASRTPEGQYIRHIEEFPIKPTKRGGATSARIIICMFPEQSGLLLKTKRPSCDTSFKGVKTSEWSEFTIEGFDVASERCEPFVCVFLAWVVFDDLGRQQWHSAAHS